MQITLERAGEVVSPREHPVPVSQKIRARLSAARERFYANDNIARHIEPGELPLLLEEVTHKLEGVLQSLVIDTEGDHNTQDTARREADHFCMQWRGVRDTDSKMINSVMRGSFLEDANLRREFLALLQR